jgi:hypothetical protein
MDAIPSARRQETLRLKLVQWTPFEHPGYNIIWQGAQAQVWTWDTAEQVRKNDSAPNGKGIVESRLTPPAMQDGARLIPCMQGVEGQIWRHKTLLASHWWAAAPAQRNWRSFLRGSGMSTLTDAPAPLSLPPLARPWGKDSNPSLSASGLEPILWRWLPLVLIFFIAWEGANIYRLWEAKGRLDATLTELRKQVAPLREARRAASQALLTAQHLRQLAPSPRQLELIDQVLKHLPSPKRMELLEWSYEPGRLRLLIQGDSLDPSLMVKALENLPWGHDVRADPGKSRDLMRLEMRLAGNP